jgi:hypothetical protein
LPTRTHAERYVLQNPRKISSQRAPGSNVDTYTSDDVQHLYADGIIATQLGGAVSKISFFRLLTQVEAPIPGPQDPKDLQARVHSCEITIPTSQLLQYCVTTINGLKASREAMAGATEAERTQFLSILDSVEVTEK